MFFFPSRKNGSLFYEIFFENDSRVKNRHGSNKKSSSWSQTASKRRKNEKNMPSKTSRSCSNLLTISDSNRVSWSRGYGGNGLGNRQGHTVCHVLVRFRSSRKIVRCTIFFWKKSLFSEKALFCKNVKIP